MPHDRAGNLGRADGWCQGWQIGGRRVCLYRCCSAHPWPLPGAPMGAAEAAPGGRLSLPPSAWGGQGTARTDQGNPAVVVPFKRRCWVRPEGFGML